MQLKKTRKKNQVNTLFQTLNTDCWLQSDNKILPLVLVASLATLAAAAGLGLVSAGLAVFSTLPLAVAGFSAFGFSAAFGFSVFPDFYKRKIQ